MKIKVESRSENFELQVNVGHKLLHFLQDAGIPVNAACGGAGSCTKCRVKIKEGFVAITAADRKAFSESELAAGWRLSCQAHPRTNLNCLVPDVENLNAKPRVIVSKEQSPCSNPVLVCDLGSTGVVVALANESGRILVETHLLNKQVRFGADVMTRLKVAQDRGVSLLHEKILESLEPCLKEIEKASPELFAKAKQKGLFCSGNSAILSFLHNWDISSLAVFPFQPLHKESFETFSEKLKINLKSLPLLGGFVGADTFAGLYYIETLKAQEPWMLVDIGTNTEIVLANGKGDFYFSSAPAGPAFEGGNIVQGMRAEAGAISHAFYRNSKWDLETIGQDKARGICGSGLMDILFEAVNGELLQKDGYLPDGKLMLNEEIYLVADDVREFQLAKSATRTACDLLIDRAGVRPQKIFLAGTFAEHLREESVRGIGLLPEQIPFETIGNSSLKGTLLFAIASSQEQKRYSAELLKKLKPLELALQDDFQDAFVRNLNF
ncbi:MAG: ASKHA domain-containing protein [bacterium]